MMIVVTWPHFAAVVGFEPGRGSRLNLAERIYAWLRHPSMNQNVQLVAVPGSMADGREIGVTLSSLGRLTEDAFWMRQLASRHGGKAARMLNNVVTHVRSAALDVPPDIAMDDDRRCASCKNLLCLAPPDVFCPRCGKHFPAREA